ncbi:MAG: serine protease [Tannerella sp.]|jgi:Tfp pilus assembly protein PilF|nr:serine protease [Tannerella sp.]
MRRILIILLFVCQAITIAAQKKNPKWIDKAGKAVFKIETTSKDGVTKTGYGFFISEKGEAVASYSIFRYAAEAVVTTATGEKWQVTHIIGADNMYDVAHFKVAVPKKTAFLTTAAASPAVNSTAYLPAAFEENAVGQGAVSEITKINGAYDYYKVEWPLPSSQACFPLLNEAGDAFALTQADATKKGKTYGISIAYILSLQISVADILKRTYTESEIRKALPTDIENAQIALLLYASQQDVATYLETLNDFIATFPEHADGYVNRATQYAYQRKELASTESEQLQMLDLAWSDLDKAAKYAAKKGDAFYNRAKLIFGVAASDSALQYKEWSIDKAEEYIRKAIAEESAPEYIKLEGDIALYKGDYEKSYNSYSIVNQSNQSSGMSFYNAAKSLMQIEGYNLLEVISLIDSAVAKSQTGEAAEYMLESIDLKIQAGLYENAVRDYDKYYLMMDGNVNDVFYYYREQAKYRANDPEGALKDIDKAIMMSDGANEVYYAEKASVYLRLKDYPKAQEAAEKAISIQPDFASAYRILGIGFIRQDKKTEACNTFNKAYELGDAVVERLIKENCNQE